MSAPDVREGLLALAEQKRWLALSMKDDFVELFADAAASVG